VHFGTIVAKVIGLGTYLGGWRIIRTLGKGITYVESPQGFTAETGTGNRSAARDGRGLNGGTS